MLTGNNALEPASLVHISSCSVFHSFNFDFQCLCQLAASLIKLQLRISLAHILHHWSLCWNWESPGEGVSSWRSPSAQAGRAQQMLGLGQIQLKATAQLASPMQGGLPHTGLLPSRVFGSLTTRGGFRSFPVSDHHRNCAC